MATTPSDQDDVLLKIERSACKILVAEPQFFLCSVKNTRLRSTRMCQINHSHRCQEPDEEEEDADDEEEKSQRDRDENRDDEKW